MITPEEHHTMGKVIATRRRVYEGSASIEDIPLANVHLLECDHCGKTHEYISNYPLQLARNQYRAVEDCPECSKRG